MCVDPEEGGEEGEEGGDEYGAAAPRRRMILLGGTPIDNSPVAIWGGPSPGNTDFFTDAQCTVPYQPRPQRTNDGTPPYSALGFRD